MKPVTLQILPDDAQNVTDGWQFARQRDFRGGENLADLPELVGRNQLRRLENAIISPAGLISDFWQCDQETANGVTIQGLVLGAPNGTGQYPFWHTSKTANKITTGIFDPLAGVTDLSAGVDHAVTAEDGVTVEQADIRGLAHAVRFLGKDYCLCGSIGGVLDLTVYRRILNGALTGVCTKLAAYDNRLWAVTAGGALIFSNNGAPLTWDAGNIILLPNQEKLIGFCPVPGGVILHSSTTIYAMYGSGTYTDTSIVPIHTDIKDGLLLSDSATIVGSMVYIASNQGVVRASLNGYEIMPHNQQEYFDSLYPVWANQDSKLAISAVYMVRFRAVLFTVWANYGAQSFLYYVDSNAFAKLSFTLADQGETPWYWPIILALPDRQIDFLIMGGSGPGSTDSDKLLKSTYPAGGLMADRVSVIQTRHEDCDSLREKIWRAFTIVAAAPAHNVIMEVFVDYAEVPTAIKFNCIDLAVGDNTIDLFDLSDEYIRGKAISFRLTLNSLEFGDLVVSDKDGQALIMSDADATVPIRSDNQIKHSAHFSIRELRVKWCEVGAQN